MVTCIMACVLQAGFTCSLELLRGCANLTNTHNTACVKESPSLLQFWESDSGRQGGLAKMMQETSGFPSCPLSPCQFLCCQSSSCNAQLVSCYWGCVYRIRGMEYWLNGSFRILRWQAVARPSICLQSQFVGREAPGQKECLSQYLDRPGRSQGGLCAME